MPLTLSDLGKVVLDTRYAVRGPIVARAQELERAGRKVIYCNIGNPQALGQKPLTYVRQVLALMEWPELATKAPEAFPEDLLATAKAILAESKNGLGAYSESKGLKFVRAAVADFIAERDSDASLTVEADPERIYLTDGASKGVQTALRLIIASDGDGIMVPIPQYPPLLGFDHPLWRSPGRLLPGGGIGLEPFATDARRSLSQGSRGGNQSQGHLRHQPGKPHRFGPLPQQYRHGHRLREGTWAFDSRRRGLPEEYLPS